MNEAIAYLGLMMVFTPPLLCLLERGTLNEADFIEWLYSRPLRQMLLLRANTLSGFLFMCIGATQKVWS